MRLSRSNNTLMIVLASLLATAAFARDAVSADLLRWKLKAGDELQIVSEQSVVSKTSYAAEAVATTVNISLESRWIVGKVAAEQIELTQQIDRIQVRLETPKTAAIIYDSADEKRPSGLARQLQSALKPLLGAQLKLTMTDRGEIVTSELPPGLAAAAGENKSSAPLVGAEAIRELVSKPPVVLPLEEVEPGATWEVKANQRSPIGDVTDERTFRLLAIDEADAGRIARIEATSKLEFEPSKAKLKVTESSLKQTVLFAVEGGNVRSTEQTMRLRTESPYRETTIAVEVDTTLKTTYDRAK